MQSLFSTVLKGWAGGFLSSALLPNTISPANPWVPTQVFTPQALKPIVSQGIPVLPAFLEDVCIHHNN